jgi:hypothetical protein
MSEKLAQSERHRVTLNDRLIYEWTQSLQTVEIYVRLPPGVKAKVLYVDLLRDHLKFGITPNPPYLDVSAPIYHYFR